MLPPIPQGLVPVTVQQDPVKPRPDIQPVTPASESEANSQVKLDERQPSGQEQRRKGKGEQEQEEEQLEEQVMPGKKPMSRKGLLVDLRV